MPGRVVDHSAKVKAAIEREMARRIRVCCILVWNHAKVLVNTEGTGVSGGYKTATKRVRKGGLIYGANPSRPGEPPHKQRGRLLASIAWEVAGLIGRVGTNVDYGRFLELGTRKMAARPWLRRALAEKTPECLAILRAPMRLAG